MNSQLCARVGLQRITFLGFIFDLRFLRILKLLHIYIFGIIKFDFEVEIESELNIEVKFEFEVAVETIFLVLPKVLF